MSKTNPVAKDLIKYIVECNELCAASNKLYSFAPLETDPAYWAAQGIYTKDEFIRDELKTAIRDTYKEIYNMKTDMSELDSLTTQELQYMLDGLNHPASIKSIDVYV